MRLDGTFSYPELQGQRTVGQATAEEQETLPFPVSEPTSVPGSIERPGAGALVGAQGGASKYATEIGFWSMNGPIGLNGFIRVTAKPSPCHAPLAHSDDAPC